MATRIALAQINPIVGDIEGNADMIERWLKSADEEGATLVAFPELALTGYPPEDLVLKDAFITDNLAALTRLAQSVKSCAIVGFVDREGPRIYNAAALIVRGEVRGVYRKQRLPNYGVFDEERYFQPGTDLLMVRLGKLIFGVTICEDLWAPDGPQVHCAAAGASLVVNMNASPYHEGKGKERLGLITQRALENRVGIAYVNLVGAQDELVFDGQSMVIDAEGTLIARAPQFEEDLLVFEIPSEGKPARVSVPVTGVEIEATEATGRPPEVRIASELDEDGEIYRALILGLKDYLRKNGGEGVIVGLSGGIDSALTATIAADALGPSNVLGVMNPSGYTSARSERDANLLAHNLGIESVTLPITDSYESILKTLDPVFAGTQPGVAEENIQARLRGLIWMAISNKFPGKLVLPTGNKSEMSVGYATLYGDMAGGLAILKDVPKTTVYRLALWRNLIRATIPESIIERPPTAELRPDQLDTDSLPPYEILDPILEAYVEQDRSVAEIAALGFDEETVRRVVAMVDGAEYKRRQSPPGLKISRRAFGRDRRLPITNQYKG